MLREGHLLHGPPRNLQERRASHGSIAPGIDNSETATDLRSLCRPAPVLVPTGTWLAWSQVNDIAGRVAQEWTPALTGAESTLTWTPKNRSCCAGHRSCCGISNGHVAVGRRGAPNRPVAVGLRRADRVAMRRQRVEVPARIGRSASLA